MTYSHKYLQPEREITMNKKYTDEFKQQAIDYYQEHGYCKTTKHFNISRSCLSRWLNPDHYKKWSKKYIKQDHVKQKHKKYMNTHKEKFAAYNKEYIKDWNKKNKEQRKKINQKWAAQNQDKLKEYQKEYRSRCEVKQREKELYDQKYATDPEFRERIRRNRIKTRENNKEKIREYRKKRCQPNQTWRLSYEYIYWRKSVFERDNHTCQHCNKTNCLVHAHHIKPASEFPELKFDIGNGITLCPKCHKKEHRQLS